LFRNIGGGLWALAEWVPPRPHDEGGTVLGNKPAASLSLSDEENLWRAISEIEHHDLVYKVLKFHGGDLSYHDICRELAERLGIDAGHLSDTSFLSVNDERLARLASGNWTLREFLAAESEPEPPHITVEPPAQEMPLPAFGDVDMTVAAPARNHHSRARLLWLIGALALVAIAAFVYFLEKE
jgi:hypothetical protein